jgi:purine-binding chemotaxis protein CheW
MSSINVDAAPVLDRPSPLVVFLLGDRRYALHLSAVERVVRMVDITPLPRAPSIVLGVINVRGQVIPVVNARRRFRLPEREITLTDQLVVARTARRLVALVADAATDVIACPERDLIAAARILPEVGYVQGVVKLKDGLVLIHDLDQFLSMEEERVLDQAMSTL